MRVSLVRVSGDGANLRQIFDEKFIGSIKKEVDSGELSLAKASCIPSFITYKSNMAGQKSTNQMKKGPIRTRPKNSSTNQPHNEILPQK